MSESPNPWNPKTSPFHPLFDLLRSCLLPNVANMNMLPVSLLTTLTLLACFFHSSIATSATTQQQLQEALRAAFGNTVQFSELLPPRTSSTTSGAKYIVDVSEKGIDTWTEAQIKTEQERNDVLPRLMTTYDGTQFRCAVPVPKMFLPPSPSFTPTPPTTTPPPPPVKKTKISDLNPSERTKLVHVAEQLVKPLSNLCFRKTEGWWTYEVCMNEKVRQYHTERRPDPLHKGQHINLEVNSYILGKYDTSTTNDPPKSANQPPKPGRRKDQDKKKVQPHPAGYNMDISNARPLALKQTFQWGTPCDLTHKPRETVLEWSCNSLSGSKKTMTYLAEVQEIATCQYLIQMKTPLLCPHEAFKVEEEEKVTIDPARLETITCHPLKSINNPNMNFYKEKRIPTTTTTQGTNVNKKKSSPATNAAINAAMAAATGAPASAIEVTTLGNDMLDKLLNSGGGMLDGELLQQLLDAQTTGDVAMTTVNIELNDAGEVGGTGMTREELVAAVRNALGGGDVEVEAFMVEGEEMEREVDDDGEDVGEET